jgi:hypothetical protein
VKEVKEKFGKLALICIISLLALDLMNFPAINLTVLSHTYPTRSYPGAGGLGNVTLWISPEDNNYTSSKPANLKNGTQFTVNVRINATKVSGWQVELAYNKNYLNTTTARVLYASDMLFPSGSYSPIAPTGDNYNSTHAYVLMTASTNGAVEYNGTNKGLITVNFTIIADPDAGGVESCSLRLMTVYASDPNQGYFGTWTVDTDLNDNALTLRDGYYENRYVARPPAYLELSPTLIERPTIEGDHIVNSSKALFSVDILINDVDAADELFFVQFVLTFNKTFIEGVWIDEGTFMNNTTWAPHGTFDNSSIPEEGKLTYWIMIAPNDTGYWDNTAWPSGDGLLATAQLEIAWQGPDPDSTPPAALVASSYLNISGIFGEFFLGHPNKDPEPDYLPYGPPINATINIYGYYWEAPVADFEWTPDPPTSGNPTTFDASTSYGYRNIDGVPTLDPTYTKEYSWNWGDSSTNTTTSPTIDHTYADPGEYNATLTVTDYDGLTGTASDAFLVFEIINHTVTYGGQNFTVTTASTGKIAPDSITMIQTHRSLYFNVSGASGTRGVLNITIPKALINAQPQDWMILLQTNIITTANGLTATNVDPQHTMLSIEFTFGSDERVFIFGTSVIPEFPGSIFTLALMALLAASATFIAASKKLKK